MSFGVVFNLTTRTGVHIPKPTPPIKGCRNTGLSSWESHAWFKGKLKGDRAFLGIPSFQHTWWMGTLTSFTLGFMFRPLLRMSPIGLHKPFLFNFTPTRVAKTRTKRLIIRVVTIYPRRADMPAGPHGAQETGLCASL